MTNQCTAPQRGRPGGGHPAYWRRRTAGTLAAIVLCAGAGLQAATPEPTPGIGTASTPAVFSVARAAADLPPAPAPSPVWSATRMVFRVPLRAPQVDDTPGFGAILPSSSWRPRPARPFTGGGFSRRLLHQMNREARRHRLESLTGLPGWEASSDSYLEEERARQAERILTRSFNRTVDHHLEGIARATPGLGRFIEWVEHLGRLRDERDPGGAAPTGTAALVSGARRDPRQGTIALKLDAHPKVLLRAEVWRIRGTLYVPLLDDPLRLKLERPLGARSRIALTGALSRDADDWATLTFQLRF